MKNKLLVIIVLVALSVFGYNRYKAYKFDNDLREYQRMSKDLDSNYSPPSNSSLNKHDISIASQEYVLQALKSPSTAEFPPTSTATVKKTPNGTYIVSSYVDSQNAFGATLRSNWVAEIRYLSGNRVELIDIQFID